MTSLIHKTTYASGIITENQKADIYKDILTNNIYGVDLNPESVEITKLSLWLKSAQKGKKLNNLDDNIKCGNSLIDDPAVAGERAFDRKKEFPDIMNAITPTSKMIAGTGRDSEMYGFDVIVGNPPYVSYYSKQSQSDNQTKEILNYLVENYNFIQDKSKL